MSSHAHHPLTAVSVCTSGSRYSIHLGPSTSKPNNKQQLTIHSFSICGSACLQLTSNQPSAWQDSPEQRDFPEVAADRHHVHLSLVVGMDNVHVRNISKG